MLELDSVTTPFAAAVFIFSDAFAWPRLLLPRQMEFENPASFASYPSETLSNPLALASYPTQVLRGFVEVEKLPTQVDLGAVFCAWALCPITTDWSLWAAVALSPTTTH